MTDLPDIDLLTDEMNRVARSIDKSMETLLPPADGYEAQVIDAMRYAVLAGGKRLRPFLVLASASLFDVPTVRATRAACAIECVHTYSLIHDDLPCMDDDDMRRGMPTTHKKFDEATAVLAGDALLTLAFEIWRMKEPIMNRWCGPNWWHHWRGKRVPMAWLAGR